MSIVVGYTPSDQGRAALAAAVRQSRALAAPLVVVSHVHAGSGAEAAGEAQVADALAAAGGQWAEARVLVDDRRDVAEALLEAAVRVEARMLVIGLRRKSPIGKLSLGASARHVVLAAPCPVLAVKEAPSPR